MRTFLIRKPSGVIETVEAQTLAVESGCLLFWSSNEIIAAFSQKSWVWAGPKERNPKDA